MFMMLVFFQSNDDNFQVASNYTSPINFNVNKIYGYSPQSNNFQVASNYTPPINICLVSPQPTPLPTQYYGYYPCIQIPNTYMFANRPYPISNPNQYLSFYQPESPDTKSRKNNIHNKNKKAQHNKPKPKSDPKIEKQTVDTSKPPKLTITTPKDPKYDTIFVQYRPYAQFEGAIRYFAYKSKSDASINVKTDASGDNYHGVENLLRDNDNYFQGMLQNARKSIIFDFRESILKIEGYTIKSSQCDINMGHLRSWTIEISDNQVDWEVVDNRNNCNDLNGRHKVVHFDVQQKTERFVRYIRMKFTGECWGYESGMILLITTIEFFGQLKIPKK